MCSFVRGTSGVGDLYEEKVKNCRSCTMEDSICRNL
jgi:hypothetical protein